MTEHPPSSRGSVSSALVLTLLVYVIPTESRGAEINGNLSVVTQIAAECTTPSPSGNLTLPFSEFRSLTGQAQSFSVTITSECTNSATISSLRFGDGLHASGTGAAHTRRMLNQNQADTYLAYHLIRTNETNRLKTSVAGDCNATPDDCNTVAYDPSQSSISYTVFGRVYDVTGTYTDQYAVPGGIYNDTVQIVVTYGN